MTAEKTLLADAARGKIARIGDKRPEEATEENTVRAGFLRFLLLGGDDQTPVHEEGILLKGAWITGVLNLKRSATVSAIDCKACFFAEPLILHRSILAGGLLLQGSCVPGIRGDGITIKGSALLCDDFKATGTVWLLGAQIHGSLNCIKAQLNGHGRDALVVVNGVIKGDVFLRNDFKANGSVRLHGAKISGDLSCSNSEFDGEGKNSLSADSAVIQGNVLLRNNFKAIGTVRLLGTQIGGDLDCSRAQFDGREHEALSARTLRVSGAFFFRNLLSQANKMDLSAASVGVLVDDTNAWGKDLILDGFSYDNIGDRGPTNATERLAWLDKQHDSMSGLSGTGTDFRPQPWKQLQKVLREMGHTEDARQVAIAFEDRLRHADLIGLSPQHWSRGRKWLYRASARGFHLGFRILTGYGYRPIRLLGWFTGIWLACATFYWFAALPPNDVFAPSNPLVFQHAEYQACAPDRPETKKEMAKPPKQQKVVGAGNWYLCSELREEYTGFSPLAYSLDVILPLVDLQQQKDWGPLIPTPQPHPWYEFRERGMKHLVRLVIWFETLFGWLASLLLVAIVSGLTKRRED